jgi:hypothetical protein
MLRDRHQAPRHCSGSGKYPQTIEYIGHVPMHRVFTDFHQASDLFIRQTLRDKFEHRALVTG